MVRQTTVAMATGLLVMVTGCSGTVGQEATRSSSTVQPTIAEPTMNVQADSYFNPTDPSNLAQWGSHLVVATLIDERKVPQTIEPGPGGEEEPMPGPTLRGIELRVEEVLWSHPQAVTPVAAGQLVSGMSSSGWAIVNDEEVAIAFDGSIRMDVGGSYVVALVDDVSEGAQVLEYLDGSAVPATEQTSADLTVEVERTAGTTDPDNVPKPLVSFDERIQHFVLAPDGE